MSASLRAIDIAEAAAGHDFSKGLFVPPAMASRPRNDGLQHTSIEEAFPNVAPGFRPVGNLVQVMLRTPLMRSMAGMVINPDERQTERDNAQVAKVIAVGPLAFRNRDTYEMWPEGVYCKVGDFVRVPKYQGDYTVVPYMRTTWEYRNDARVEEIVEDRVVFAQFKDIALLGVYDTAEDALAARSFL